MLIQALKDAIYEYIEDKIEIQVDEDLKKYGDDNGKWIKYLFSLFRNGTLNKFKNNCINIFKFKNFFRYHWMSFTSGVMGNVCINIQAFMGFHNPNKISLNGVDIMSTIGDFSFILTILKIFKFIYKFIKVMIQILGIRLSLSSFHQ